MPTSSLCGHTERIGCRANLPPGPQQADQTPMAPVLLALITLVLMYGLLVRPQQQRVRRHRDLVMSLELGDEVITAGGILGTIVALEDDVVELQISPATTIRLLRLAVSQRAEDMPAIETADDTRDDS